MSARSQPQVFSCRESFSNVPSHQTRRKLKSSKRSSSYTSSTASPKKHPAPPPPQKTAAAPDSQTQNHSSPNAFEKSKRSIPALNARSNTPPSNSSQSQSAETPTSYIPSPQSPNKTQLGTENKSPR